MRLFGRVKAAFTNAFTTYHNLSSPFSLMSANTKKANFVGFGCFANVLKIANTINFPQVGKSVVFFVSILVVNMFQRAISRHVQPCKAVSQSFFVVNCNSPIPRISRASCSFSNKVWAAVMCFPCKLPRFRIVVKDGSDMVMCNHEFDFTIKVTA